MQWLPGVRAEPETGCAVHRLLAGTHTNREEPDHLLVLEVRLPATTPGAATPAATVRRESVRVARARPHDGEVNRARSMPQHSALVATLSPARDGRGQAFVYNIADDDATGAAASAASGPVQRLGGMRAEGYGLAWSPHHAGLLAAGGNDGAVLVWDTAASSSSSSSSSAAEPVVRAAHGATVEDVAWDPHAAHVLASVGDDGALRLWDVRVGGTAVAASATAVGVHAARHGRTECNSVAFAPRWEHLYATGGADGVVALWDARRAAHPLHAMEHHTGAVYGVVWAADSGTGDGADADGTLVASAATDRRVMLWDIARIGDEQSADDANDGPPELVFVHSGHTAGVSEFALCPGAPWAVASVDSDNALQVWQPAANIRAPDDLSRPPTAAAAADLE